MRNVIVGGACAVALLAAGCGTAGTKARIAPTSGEVRAVHIMTLPVGLNLDKVPGPDGFSLRLYTLRGNDPKPVAIREGEIEIFMFDGPDNAEVLQSWKFSAQQLRGKEVESSIGAGYQFLLAWGTNQPSKRQIIVTAEHRSPAGRTVRSAPSAITVADREPPRN